MFLFKHSKIMGIFLLLSASGCFMDPISSGEETNVKEPSKVGDQFPSPTPGLPDGTVTEVNPIIPTSVSPIQVPDIPKPNSPVGPFQWITITFPSPWNCPADDTYLGMGGYPTISTGSKSIPSSKPELTIRTCAELAALRRPELKRQAEESLKNAKREALAKNCAQRTEIRCQDSQGKFVESSYCYVRISYTMDAGMAYSYPSGTGGTMAQNPVAASAGGSVATGGSTGATQYSTTNLQVASVDEADYVKNDSNTFFVLSKDGLRVIDAWPAAETRQIARIAIPGEPRRLFLEANRLVVYTRMQAAGMGAGSSNPSDQGCTYGYDCRFTSEGGHTLAIVFDVTLPASPKELARYEFSGGYVASRRVGPYVYTVLHDTGAAQIPGLDFSLPATSYQQMQVLFNQRLAENSALIDRTSDDYFLPWMKLTRANGTESKVSACKQALAADAVTGLNYVSLTSFNLTQLEPPVRTVVASNPGYVYASASALYLAVDRIPEVDYSRGYGYASYRPDDSVVHKFSLNGTESRYAGSALLPGHILNQFSMDEHLGVLRVASTQGWVPDSRVQSYLSTYGEKNNTLVPLGSLGGIAPTEDIRSVRFDGDRGYVVTFKKTDPLFTFDLSDPAAPRLLGELKIPGFSTYMHRLDANHILAVGFEADDKGNFAYFNGIQIQIFDVTVLSSPKLLWKKVIGTRGSNSEALTNHLAFNYFAPKKMLAMPITICEGGGNGMSGDRMTFAGLMALDISLETGIQEHGRLPFADPNEASTLGSCNQWWTDSKSLVKRSIFMDDWVYGLSDGQLRVAALAKMSTPLQTVSLAGP